MWSYNQKRKSEPKLVKMIKEKFDPSGNGSNIVLAYGNWKETQQMKGLMPSPTTGIKWTLMQHFKVVTVPEYNTTITCSKCNQPTMDSFLSRPHHQWKKRRKWWHQVPSPSMLPLLPEGSESTTATATEAVLAATSTISSTTTAGGEGDQMEAEKVYPVCCCKNEYCGVIMDRDYNAAINIQRNLLHFIENGDWLPCFSKKKKKHNKSQQQ